MAGTDASNAAATAAAGPDAAPRKAADQSAGLPPPPAHEPKKNFLGMITSCAENVRPAIRPAMPTLEQLRASPHYPVLVTPAPNQPGDAVNYCGSTDLTKPVPINGPYIEWENDVWKGRLSAHIRGLSTSVGKVFDGKKRVTWGCAQGQFKVPCKATDLAIGQEIEVRAKGPSEYIIQWVTTQIAHTFSQTCKVDVNCEHPYFLNPLLAACQIVNVSRPGEEPQVLEDTEEDSRLLHPALVEADGSPWEADRRRKWCDTPANIQDLVLMPGLVYTFVWYQHFFDMASYKAHVGPVSVDLVPFMCAQPIQLFIKHTGLGVPMLQLLVWHERLLYPEAASKRSKKVAAAAAKAPKGAKGAAGEKGAGAREGGDEDDTATIDVDKESGSALAERFKGLLSGWRS